MDAAGVGDLSGLHGLGDDEELEGECDISIPAHEADVLDRSNRINHYLYIYYIDMKDVFAFIEQDIREGIIIIFTCSILICIACLMDMWTSIELNITRYQSKADGI